jgi:prepilin-type N-terminal cleavage/methylation domain-containing protein
MTNETSRRSVTTDDAPARNTPERGFTMLEMIVVVAVIAVLASIAIPLAAIFEDRAREEATEREMQSLEKALVAWYEDHDSFPADLDSLVDNGYLAAGLDSLGHSQDAWFNDYVYTPTSMTANLRSWGIDRTASTSDDLLLQVSAGASARAETRDEMETIHVALRNYESVRVVSSLPSLPNHWDVSGPTDGAFQMLISEGLIPNEVRFLTDSWGSTYAYAGTPSDAVASPGLGAGP